MGALGGKRQGGFSGHWRHGGKRWGVGQQPVDETVIECFVAAVRERLNVATFKAATEEGRAMPLEQAVAFALGENDG